MVVARERFLGRGHYQPLSTTIAVLAAEHDPGANGIVVDLAGGTGHYLSAVLDVRPHRHGLCLDASTPALRRAARVHPRVAAIGADVWSPLPVRTGVANVVLSVFGPRNITEMTRILGPKGIVIAATPHPTHLMELAPLVGTVGVDPCKPERLAASFEGFERLAHQEVTWRVALHRQDVHDVTAMGPAARHITDYDLGQLVALLPEVVGATVAVEVSVYRRSSGR
jgi:23S rRNA (guanine745-N1)-methyltransferase